MESLAKPFAITGARRLSDRQAPAWSPAASAWQTLLVVVRKCDLIASLYPSAIL